jgi:hypothetical protein
MLTLRPTAATVSDFQGRIESIRKLARPQPDLVQEVQRAILQGYENNFDSESAGGSKWAALAASTILDRLSQGYGAGPILVREGDYRSSWINEGDANHVHEVEQLAGGWRLSEGSAHDLVPFHEEGTRNMPARSVFELDVGDENRIRQIVDNYILRTLMQR